MNTNEKGNMRVATYTRVSTQEQAQEGTSLDFQDSQLTALCQMQGWTLTDSFVDAGFTGKDGSRPGLERLLANAKIGLFDRVVVYKLDRLARNLRLLLEIEQKLRASNVTITSTKESVDTSTSTGKMIFQVLGLVSEWERDSIVERTRSGRLQRYKEGRWAGGAVIFGYSYNKSTKKLVIDETEARIVRRIYADYRDGKSLHGISEGLNKDKIPGRTKHALGWRQNVIRDILLNPMYKGTQIVNRHAPISKINSIDLDNTIQIPVPPIVDEQTWNIAQERLKNNKHVKPGKQGEFLLQGMITCGLCGYAYRADRDRNNRYYICRGKLKDHHLDGSPRCDSRYLNATWLEKQVWERVKEVINDPNRLAAVIKDSIETLKDKETDLSARIRPMEHRLAEIAEQKARLADDWVARNMDSHKFNELKTNLEQEEGRIRALKSEIDPAQIADLEATGGVLRFWENQLQSMAWNTESEDGSMARLVNEPHRIALKVVGFEDKTINENIGFPASRRELLDKLQMKLVVFNDRIEVNGLFSIQPIDVQSLTSIRGE